MDEKKECLAEEKAKRGRPRLLSDTMEKFLKDSSGHIGKRSLQNRNYFFSAMNALLDDDYFASFYRLRGDQKQYASCVLVELGRFGDKESIRVMAKALDDRIKADAKEGIKHTVHDLAKMLRAARLETKKEAKEHLACEEICQF